MDPATYGPFANLLAIACALVATFSLLVVKMVGKVKQWTWLSSDSPSFLVTAGARVLAIAVMAVIYVTLDKSNYRWFALVGLACGAAGFIAILMFERLRREHVISVPVVAASGKQASDPRGRPQVSNLVIGREEDMNPDAKKRYEAARKRSGVSLVMFLSGYGRAINDPTAVWDRGLLARIGSRLTLALMCIILFAALTLFNAALVIQVATRPA